MGAPQVCLEGKELIWDVCSTYCISTILLISPDSTTREGVHWHIFLQSVQAFMGLMVWPSPFRAR